MNEKPVRYQTNHEGFYVGLAEIDPDPEREGEWLIPGGTVEIEPPPQAEGKVRYWDGGAWQYIDVPPLPYLNEPQPETLEQHRRHVLALLEAELAQRLAGMFNAQPDENGTWWLFPAGQADALLLMMAAQQANGAPPEWTTPLRAQAPGDSAPTDHAFNRDQVPRIVAAWQDFVRQVRAANDAKRARANAATTHQELEDAPHDQAPAMPSE